MKLRTITGKIPFKQMLEQHKTKERENIFLVQENNGVGWISPITKGDSHEIHTIL